MDMSGQFSADSCPDYAMLVTVSDADVRQTMLERSLTNTFGKHAINFIPLAVLLVNAMSMPRPVIIHALITVQIIVVVMAAWAAHALLRAFKRDKNARKLHMTWLFLEGATAAIWGLMLYSITDPALTKQSFSIVAVTICCTIIAATIKASSTPGLSKIQLAAFALTSIPISSMFYNDFGVSVVIGLAALPIAASLGASQLVKESRKNIKTEIENRLLAQHLTDALEVADFVSRYDSLTNLLNRRELANNAARLRAKHRGRPVTAMLLDLDHFKNINDKFGHAAGDSALRATADILRDVVSDGNSACSDQHALARWGGEEFVILIADLETQDALKLGEKICQRLARHHEKDWPSDMAITASIGSAIWMTGEPLDSAIARADKAMYNAKNNGRNAFVHQER